MFVLKKVEYLEMQEFLYIPQSHTDNKSFKLKYPTVRLLIPFVLGIVIAEFTNVNTKFTLITISVFLLFTSLTILKNKALQALSIFITFLNFGIYVHNQNNTLQKVNLPKHKVVYIGIIEDDPKFKSKTVQIPVRLIAYKDSILKQINTNAKALLYIQKDSALNLGYKDSIIFASYISEVQNNGIPYEFNYKKYLARKGILYTGYVKSDEIIVVSKNKSKDLMSVAYRIKHYLLSNLRRYGMSDTNYQIAGALLLGYRNELSRDVQDTFSKTGAMHVLAVSGLHVGIIYGFLMLLMYPLKFRRTTNFIATLIVVAFLGLFAIITGLSPSVKRAVIMFSAIAIGRATGRRTNVFNSLGLAAFIILILDTNELFAAGFWFSFLAVLSIVLFYPVIYGWIKVKNIFLDKVWSLVAVSIAAQLGTFPIGIYLFNQFSNLFIITNLIAIPMASFILYFGLMFFVFVSLNIEILAKFMFKALNFSIDVLWKSLDFMDNLSFSFTKGLYINFGQMVSLYLIIFSMFLLFKAFSAKKLAYTLSFITMFLLMGRIDDRNFSAPEVWIFKINNITAINFLSPTTNILLTDSITNFSTLEKFWTLRNYPAPKVILLNQNYQNNEFIYYRKFIKFHSFTAYLLYDNSILDSIANSPFSLDAIIIAQNPYIKLEELNNLFSGYQLIATSSNKIWRVNYWKRKAQELGIQFLSAFDGSIRIKATSYSPTSNFQYFTLNEIETR